MAQTLVESGALDSILMEPVLLHQTTNTRLTKEDAKYNSPTIRHNSIKYPAASAFFGAVVLPFIAYSAHVISDGTLNADPKILEQLAFYGGLAGLTMGFLNSLNRKDYS